MTDARAPLRIFIGYDPREAVAYHVCVNSIIRYASVPVSITPLALNNLRGLYSETHGDGSNDFIYSRFLVPYLCGYKGLALYLDGDMLVRDDVAKVFDLFDHHSAVQVVKHDYKTKQPVKYLGAPNVDYPRKNWSSVILWNCYAAANQCLTPEYVMAQTGAHLHRFAWIPEDRIGSLPMEWNWLVGEYDRNEDAKLYHYTLGTPCFAAYRACDHADEWWKEWHRMCEASDE